MKRTKDWFSVLPSLVIPVCLGLSLYLGLLALIDRQILDDQTLLRYLTGHPVSKISVGLFLVGCSSLALVGWDVFLQFFGEKKITLAGVSSPAPESVGSATGSPDDVPSSDQIAAQAAACSREMLALPIRYREHYLWQRLASGIQSIYRTGSVAKIEEELKYLADLDRDKQQQRYSLVQILIWATPMLGFLGTVLGISQALGGIAVGPENDFQQMMDGLKGSLYVAFDTTALALTLSMILMFGQFLVDRFESQLLQVVDQRVHYEITQQFDLSVPEGSSKLSDSDLENRIVAAVESAAEKQVSAWEQSVLTVGRHWSDAVQSGSQQLDRELNDAIDFSVSRLARSLEEAIDRADLSMSHRWEQWQVMLSENARLIAKNQGELIAQTQALCHLVDKQGEPSSAWDQPVVASVSGVGPAHPQEERLVFNQAVAGESIFQSAADDPLQEKMQEEIQEAMDSAKNQDPLWPREFPAGATRERETALRSRLIENFKPLKPASFRKPSKGSNLLGKFQAEGEGAVVLSFNAAKERPASPAVTPFPDPSEHGIEPNTPTSPTNSDLIPDPVIVPFIRKAA